ncbi:hypothetical protein [Pseudovibrio sp. POLY-S9]|uniref:hypothetical protein n=1 Tax=Pseudovibrio sp. POLY-S9 TaxID=1576596 RepID=UPI00070A1D4B|nr:hypothetical protein [Pseudovibrio sp. POLY-S9]
MGRALAFSYGILSYIVFFLTFLYAIGFVANIVVPKGIDSGSPGAFLPSLGINLLLLTIFALQHSVMARPGFKLIWKKIIPQPIERSTYVLLSSLALCLIFFYWQPMARVVWDVSGTPLGLALVGIYWVGWLIVLSSTFMTVSAGCIFPICAA